MEKQLQNKEQEEQFGCTTPKPEIPKGQYGDWECQGDTWVWVPEV